MSGVDGNVDGGINPCPVLHSKKIGSILTFMNHVILRRHASYQRRIHHDEEAEPYYKYGIICFRRPPG